MNTIPTARPSRTNLMNTHLKQCFKLNNKSSDAKLIGDFCIADLTRYRKVWKKCFKPSNGVICGIGGERV